MPGPCPSATSLCHSWVPLGVWSWLWARPPAPPAAAAHTRTKETPELYVKTTDVSAHAHRGAQGRGARALPALHGVSSAACGPPPPQDTIHIFNILKPNQARTHSTCRGAAALWHHPAACVALSPAAGRHSESGFGGAAADPPRPLHRRVLGRAGSPCRAPCPSRGRDAGGILPVPGRHAMPLHAGSP